MLAGLRLEKIQNKAYIPIVDNWLYFLRVVEIIIPRRLPVQGNDFCRIPVQAHKFGWFSVQDISKFRHCCFLTIECHVLSGHCSSFWNKTVSHWLYCFSN